MKSTLLATLAVTLTAPIAMAQSDHSVAGMKHMSGMSDAAHTMIQGMDIEPSGDADIDFARGMIVHHQGAIDMAQILLETGDDPEMLELAGTVIDAQQEEIQFMQDWLDRNGG